MASSLKQLLNWGKEHPITATAIAVGSVLVVAGTIYVITPYLLRILGAVGSGLVNGVASRPQKKPACCKASQKNVYKCKEQSLQIPSVDIISETIPTPLVGSALKPGRPCQHSSCESIKKGLIGIYRIRDTEGAYKYIGKTIDMRRRCQEHSRRGLFNEHSESFEVLTAKREASIIQLFIAEKEQIRRHSPYLNKTAGENGR
ncbi:GIY-YIG nuclease family protein [Shewanella indica]|uniref:GIY-YIG nuclease family protein n=1 Tax=Shewanella indica TaxID=768528 RepID=UPI00399A3CDF